MKYPHRDIPYKNLAYLDFLDKYESGIWDHILQLGEYAHFYLENGTKTILVPFTINTSIFVSSIPDFDITSGFFERSHYDFLSKDVIRKASKGYAGTWGYLKFSDRKSYHDTRISNAKDIEMCTIIKIDPDSLSAPFDAFSMISVTHPSFLAYTYLSFKSTDIYTLMNGLETKEIDIIAFKIKELTYNYTSHQDLRDLLVKTCLIIKDPVERQACIDELCLSELPI